MKPTFRTLFAAFLLTAILASTIALAQPAAPPAPSRTTPGSSRTRELVEQLRRSRSTQQNAARRSTQGTGLVTMNLTGLETFGDALGAGLLGGTEFYYTPQTFSMNSGMFLGPQRSGDLFTAGLTSLVGGPSYSLSQDTGGATNFNFDALPASVQSDVVAYLGRVAAGKTGNFDVTLSDGLEDYLRANGVDETLLSWDHAGSYGNFAGSVFDGKILFNYLAATEVDIPVAGSNTYGLGRQKITENMTPVPTDRFIFDYSYFHNVPLGYRDMSVNRFTPGFEKTFFRKRFSVEMRLPFATTIDSTMYSNNENELNKLRLGDMTVVLKYLALYGDKFALTVGLGISVPLADDMRLVDAATGVDVIRWKNETCHLMPYVGLLYMPTDRLFFQGYFQVDASTLGDPTLIGDASDPDAGMVRAGKTYERTYAYTSLAAGYWLFRKYNRDNMLRRGMNLIGELHWTQSLDRSEGIYYERDGHRFNIGNATGNYTVLNMTLGSRFQLNEKLNVGLGYAVPLSSGHQRQFDGEFRMTLNRYF